LNIERLNFPVLSSRTEHSVALTVQFSWNGRQIR
jgi:hypothetical protein